MSDVPGTVECFATRLTSAWRQGLVEVMGSIDRTDRATRLAAALAAAQSSDRLQAALTAGTDPDPDDVEVLIERCAVEPDFYVRDMLTWSLARHPASSTVPLLVRELQRDATQARSQALHTLSKIGDPAAWPAITTDLLDDPDDEVARSAWRAAVVLVPQEDEPGLARVLAAQLGRRSGEVQRSLSRALAALGVAAESAVADAALSDDEDVRLHALTTQQLFDDPELGFEAALYEARQLIARTG